jgi:hypothetical protein
MRIFEIVSLKEDFNLLVHVLMINSLIIQEIVIAILFHINSIISCIWVAVFKVEKVRLLLMYDTRPFEQKLFKTISQDIPFLPQLLIYNFEPQNNEQHFNSIL